MAVVAVAALALGACGSLGESPAAVVNGERITTSSLLDEVETIRSNEELRQRNEADFGLGLAGASSGTFDARFLSQVLQLRIYFELIEQELDELGVTISDEDLADARRAVLERAGADGIDLESFPSAYLDRIVRQEALINAIGPALVGADEEAFFEENLDSFTERCISHIFVSFDQRAPDDARARVDELQAQLEMGVAYEVVASEQSDDQAAAAEGGSLGCGLAGRFIPQFEEAANELDEGEVSQPVETPLGFHIIRMDEVREPTFEESREAVARQLQSRIGPAIQEFLIRATTESDVEVNPRFGEWVVDDSQGPAFGRVRPPAGPTTTTVPVADPFESAP